MFNTHDPQSVVKHRKRYIALTVFIFFLVALSHLLRIIYSAQVQFGSLTIPMSISWLALVVTALMILMGLSYLRHK